MYSPKEFLRERRPDQFSDSIIINQTQIDRVSLEYYLDTLSSRSQELEFESFVKNLCQVEICPNLLPHTGPTGGGDSKVDSETYPISEDISLNYFVGINSKPNNDRWAFAFSIKKDWKSKIKSDVLKIYETSRDYKVIYFVSNQYISDKKRSDTEDELRKLYSIDIRILDRSWILDKIFKNKREEIAINELHMGLIYKDESKKGFLDSKKEEILVDLDSDIEKSISTGSVNLITIKNSIDSAIISRELERPRIETEGRFRRAEELSKRHGTIRDIFDVKYQDAWTNFWWYEDEYNFTTLYLEVEEISNSTLLSDNIYILERLNNLWVLLSILEKKKFQFNECDFFLNHSNILKTRISDIAKLEEEKPTASLYAKCLLIHIELVERGFKNIDDLLIELKDIINKSKNLIGFPLEQFIDIILELEEVMDSSIYYNDLFKTIVTISEERDGELSSAKLLLERGRRLLLLNKPYEAIQEIGVSLKKLYKNESKHDEIIAMFYIGIAYEMIDLNWAARGSFLMAASLASSDFLDNNSIDDIQLKCYKELELIELKLGRIPQSLDWQNILNSFKAAFGIRYKKPNDFDILLGVLLLRSNLELLKKMEHMPGVLEDLELYFSSMALLYCFELTDEMPRDFVDSFSDEADMYNFFSDFATQDFNNRIPLSLEMDDDVVSLKSNILGCKIILNTENKHPLLDLSESIISAIEGLYSTGILYNSIMKESCIKINVSLVEKDKLIEFEFKEDEEFPVININCKDFNPNTINIQEQGEIKNHINLLLLEIAKKFIFFKDPENDIVKILKEEKAQERAIEFSSSFIILGNILGHSPKIKLSDWYDNNKYKIYKNKRFETIKFLKQENKESSKKDESIKLDDKEEQEIGYLKHTDLETVSVIKEEFWNNAKWSGTCYADFGGAGPILAIIFNNIEFGEKIFINWKNKFGDYDDEEKIRITILTNFDISKPFDYRVGIGSNIDIAKDKGSAKRTASIMRINDMIGKSLDNLNKFKSSYDSHKQYLLAPAFIKPDGGIEILFKHGIVKKNINFKEPSDINDNKDIDSVLLIK